MVSVLLLTHNQAKYIASCIEGALSQITNFQVEIVIGEDASTDETANICRRYLQKHPGRIKLISSANNIGLNQNFIRSFRFCKGKYIAYLEGDDWWIDRNKLQKQVDILESNPDVSLVHTNCKLYKEEDNRYQNHLIQYEGVCIRERNRGIDGVIAEFEGKQRPMKTSTVCYRRDLMAQILAEDEYLFANPEFPTQDFQLFQEMALKGRFVFLDVDTTVIAHHESLSVSQNPEKRLRFRRGFFKIGLYLIEKYNLPATAAQKWFWRELNYFIDDARVRQDSRTLREVMTDAKDKGYKAPVKQRIKYNIATLFY